VIPEVSVVVPTWNTRALLRACLDSLDRQRPDVRLEVIVVDNASDDGTAEMVATDHPWVTLVANTENRGYSGGANAGLAHARGAIVVVLNSDTIVHDGALARLHAALQARPDVGAACPRTLDPHGRLQSIGAGLLTPADYLGRIFGRYRPDPDRDPDASGYVGSASGACMTLTRRALDQLGGFDEGLPLFLEEQDLARRLARSGLRCYYVADAAITHVGSQTVRQLDPNDVWLATHRSHAYFYRRHFPGVTGLTLRMAAVLMMALSIARNAFRQDRLRVRVAALRAYLRA
jgi:GT2 family glycosyltransferase